MKPTLHLHAHKTEVKCVENLQLNKQDKTLYFTSFKTFYFFIWELETQTMLPVLCWLTSQMISATAKS